MERQESSRLFRFRRANPTQETVTPESQPHRLMAINQELGLDDIEAPDYLRYGNLINRFVSLGGKLDEIKELPDTKHDKAHDIYHAKRLFIKNIDVGSATIDYNENNYHYENIRLGLQFGYSRGALSFIDVLWFTNSTDLSRMYEGQTDEHYALDPIRLVREDFYLLENAEYTAEIKRLERALNYTARAIEIYAGAYEELQAARRPSKRKNRTSRCQTPPDKITEAVGNILSATEPD